MLLNPSYDRVEFVVRGLHDEGPTSESVPKDSEVVISPSEEPQLVGAPAIESAGILPSGVESFDADHDSEAIVQRHDLEPRCPDDPRRTSTEDGLAFQPFVTDVEGNMCLVTDADDQGETTMRLYLSESGCSDDAREVSTADIVVLQRGHTDLEEDLQLATEDNNGWQNHETCTALDGGSSGNITETHRRFAPGMELPAAPDLSVFERDGDIRFVGRHDHELDYTSSRDLCTWHCGRKGVEKAGQHKEDRPLTHHDIEFDVMCCYSVASVDK